MDQQEANVSKFSNYRLSTDYHNVVKINLKRAVIDHVLEFKEFIFNRHSESTKNLILDFSETNFIDSSFLGTIISILKKVKLEQGSLSLVIDSSKITFLLPVKEISKVINIYPTIDDAVAESNRFTIV